LRCLLGRLPNELPTADIYVGIDLVNPVGNGRGVFNKRQLFKTKPNHAALVPLSGVLPADTCDTTPPLIANGLEVRSDFIYPSKTRYAFVNVCDEICMQSINLFERC